MYKTRDFSAMPILADALQDSGCDNEDILSHCREPGGHVRGYLEMLLEGLLFRDPSEHITPQHRTTASSPTDLCTAFTPGILDPMPFRVLVAGPRHSS
jgi:hypothetical protein